MPRDYRKAECLKRLLEQVNFAYPGRDKTSDGWIGDTAHASRKSDHNPWVIDRKGIGVVTAIDIDEDLTINLHSLAEIVDAICASGDPRVKYFIYEGRITVQGSGLKAWKKYTGTNAHKHHAHISVFPDAKFYDDRSDWSIKNGIFVATNAPDVEQFYFIVKRDTLSAIARQFATSVPSLMQLNNLKSPDVIYTGQKLRVK